LPKYRRSVPDISYSEAVGRHESENEWRKKL
jgi:hypothetical protein